MVATFGLIGSDTNFCFSNKTPCFFWFFDSRSHFAYDSYKILVFAAFLKILLQFLFFNLVCLSGFKALSGMPWKTATCSKKLLLNRKWMSSRLRHENLTICSFLFLCYNHVTSWFSKAYLIKLEHRFLHSGIKIGHLPKKLKLSTILRYTVRIVIKKHINLFYESDILPFEKSEIIIKILLLIRFCQLWRAL